MNDSVKERTWGPLEAAFSCILCISAVYTNHHPCQSLKLACGCSICTPTHTHACTHRNRKRLKSKRENMFPLACGFRVPGPSSGESIAFRSVVPRGSGREPTGEQNDSPHKQAAKKHEAGASLFTIPTACKAFYKARLLKSCTGSQAPPLRPRL